MAACSAAWPSLPVGCQMPRHNLCVHHTLVGRYVRSSRDSMAWAFEGEGGAAAGWKKVRGPPALAIASAMQARCSPVSAQAMPHTASRSVCVEKQGRGRDCAELGSRRQVLR